MKNNTYTATITPMAINISITEDDQEIFSHKIDITGDQFDALEAGTLDSDAFTVPGWTLSEMECDREYRHGVAARK